MEKQTVSTFRLSLKWGIFSGLVYILYTLFLLFSDFFTNQILNWAASLISIIFIFLAVRDFKTKSLGFIDFSKALGLGIMTTIISSFIYNSFFFIYFSYIDDSALELVKQAQIQTYSEQGLNERQIRQILKQAESFQTPFMYSIIMFAMNLFFGIIFSLIIASILKKKDTLYSA